MRLKLIREIFTSESTIGSLYIDDQFHCFTLEDCAREAKIPGYTAIPTGTYEVVLSPSKKFEKLLPELLKVPGFEGIRIHAGNTAVDTRGCILVGAIKEENRIGKSKEAMARLMWRLQTSPAPISLTISNVVPSK